MWSANLHRRRHIVVPRGLGAVLDPARGLVVSVDDLVDAPVQQLRCLPLPIGVVVPAAA